MKFLVCISCVPDTTSKISFVEDGTALDTRDIQFIINPYDDYALARAVELKEQHGAAVSVLHVGPATNEPLLRRALAIGADNAIRVDLTPKDAAQTAYQIAHVVKEGDYNLILMGRETSDFNGSAVHAMVASLLDVPVVFPVMRLDMVTNVPDKVLVEVEKEGGKATYEVTCPAVLCCQEPIAEWKIPNMRGIVQARTKKLDVLPSIEAVEEVASERFTLPKARSGVHLVTDTNELLRLLREEAKVL